MCECGVGVEKGEQSRLRLHFHNFCTTKSEKDDKSAKGTKRSAVNFKAVEFMQQILTYHTNTLAVAHAHINCKQNFSCNSCKAQDASVGEEAGRGEAEEDGRSSRCPICAWASKNSDNKTH